MTLPHRQIRLTLGGAPAEARRLNEWYDSEMAAAGSPRDHVAELKLCLNEAVANAISYAFKDQPEPQMQVTITIGEGWVSAELRDNGFSFDPLTVPEREKLKNLDDGPIGGFGVQIMRQHASELSYRREEGWNVLTMRCG